MVKSSIFKYVQQNVKYITAVPAPDDGCQHPKHVELPTEM